jgi:hypothetical protein
MKVYRYGWGFTLVTLLVSQFVTIAAANSPQPLATVPDFRQTALKQTEAVYITDRQFTKGEWSFRVLQAGSDLKYQGSSLIRGKDISVNRVKRTKSQGRLTYTWQPGSSTFYIISWQPADPTFARLKIVKAGNTLVNELLEEEKSEDP